MADDAGAQLVRAGLISKADLDRARARRQESGGTTTEHLVAAGAIADEALTQFLSTHFMVPRVQPDALSKVPAPVRARLPADLAIELRAVPLAMDREDNLTVALSDPSDRHTVDQIRFFTGAYVVRAVCTQMQLAWALAHYYGHLTDLGRRLADPAGPTGPAPAASAPAPAPGATAAVSPAALAASPPALDPELTSTAPMPRVRPRRAASVSVSGFGDEETDATGPMKQIVAPPRHGIDELAPRSGEITAPAAPVFEPTERLPAVVVEDWQDLSGLEEVDGRSPSRTPATAGDPIPRSRDTDNQAMTTSGSKDARGPARVTPVDDGWDMDEWSIPGPGTTAPPPVAEVPEVATERVAQRGELSVPAGLAAPGEGIPTERIQVVDPELVDASAQRLLVALKGVEEGTSRDAVLGATLTFMGGATARAGFAAMKGGHLVGHSGPGGIARGGDVDLESGPLGAAMARPAPYRGPVSGAEATFVANLVGGSTPEVTAVPVVVRSRLVGVLVGDAVTALIDEHLTVLARATGLALERVLKATKR